MKHNHISTFQYMMTHEKELKPECFSKTYTNCGKENLYGIYGFLERQEECISSELVVLSLETDLKRRSIQLGLVLTYHCVRVSHLLSKERLCNGYFSSSWLNMNRPRKLTRNIIIV